MKKSAINILFDDSYHPLSKFFFLLSVDVIMYSKKKEPKERILNNIKEELNGTKYN